MNILPELKHNEFIYKLVCKDTRVPIALYLKTNWLHGLDYGIFTKPQIISEHFKTGNSDYIPRVRQQYEINLKALHIRDELSQVFARIVLNEEI